MTGNPDDRAPPYPADTRAKGWRFELDLERIAQSDTWAVAPAELRPWLLMLWSVAWMQTPCGSMPSDDELIAARLGMPGKAFAKARAVLLRGWWPATDGRLYHDTLFERVLDMLGSKAKDRERKAAYRLRMDAERRRTPSAVPRDSGGTDIGRAAESGGGDATSTGTSTKEERHSAPDGAGAAGALPDPADVIFALGLPLLTSAGVLDRNARSMLGLLRKQRGDAAVIAALERCAQEKPLQPAAWLQAALKPTRGSNHAGFAGKDYRAGVAADGTFS